MSSTNETAKRYFTISGKIPSTYAEELRNYDISDPNSEKFLEHCRWEDYRDKNSYQNCIAKDSDYYLSVENEYNFEDLQNAIRTFTRNDSTGYPWHINQMNQNYLIFIF